MCWCIVVVLSTHTASFWLPSLMFCVQHGFYLIEPTLRHSYMLYYNHHLWPFCSCGGVSIELFDILLLGKACLQRAITTDILLPSRLSYLHFILYYTASIFLSLATYHDHTHHRQHSIATMHIAKSKWVQLPHHFIRYCLWSTQYTTASLVPYMRSFAW